MTFVFFGAVLFFIYGAFRPFRGAPRWKRGHYAAMAVILTVIWFVMLISAGSESGGGDAEVEGWTQYDECMANAKGNEAVDACKAAAGYGAPDSGIKAATPYADEMAQVNFNSGSQIAVKSRLKDPDSAQFQNVRFYSGSGQPVTCGEVNGKNGFGGYNGFVQFVASGALVFLASDMTNSEEWAKSWNRFCVKASTDQAGW